MGYKVVVAGATGNVGREMLNILAEREFPVDEIAVLASRKSLGTEVSFGERTLKTQDLDTFDFTGWDIALFAVGSGPTKEYAPKAAAAGCIVIVRAGDGWAAGSTGYPRRSACHPLTLATVRRSWKSLAWPLRAKVRLRATPSTRQRTCHLTSSRLEESPACLLPTGRIG